MERLKYPQYHLYELNKPNKERAPEPVLLVTVSILWVFVPHRRRCVPTPESKSNAKSSVTAIVFFFLQMSAQSGPYTSCGISALLAESTQQCLYHLREAHQGLQQVEKDGLGALEFC